MNWYHDDKLSKTPGSVLVRKHAQRIHTSAARIRCSSWWTEIFLHQNVRTRIANELMSPTGHENSVNIRTEPRTWQTKLESMALRSLRPLHNSSVGHGRCCPLRSLSLHHRHLHNHEVGEQSRAAEAERPGTPTTPSPKPWRHNQSHNWISSNCQLQFKKQISDRKTVTLRSNFSITYNNVRSEISNGGCGSGSGIHLAVELVRDAFMQIASDDTWTSRVFWPSLESILGCTVLWIYPGNSRWFRASLISLLLSSFVSQTEFWSFMLIFNRLDADLCLDLDDLGKESRLHDACGGVDRWLT